MKSPDLKDVYTDILLQSSGMPAQGSEAFDHIIAQCISPVNARVERYIQQHSVGQVNEERAGGIAQGLLSGKMGWVLPSIQPYRVVSSSEAVLKEASPVATDPAFLGFEATARGLLTDGRIVDAGTLFWKNQKDHDRLDLAVMRGAVRVGRGLNRLRTNPLTVSSNATSALLARTDFVERILGVLNEEGFDPHQFILEILEDNDLSEGREGKCERLKDLSDAGVRLSMDDLGRKKSLANLGILVEANIPIHEVKFDGQDTVQMTNPDRWAYMDGLLGRANDAGATQLVWEGFWKGFGVEVISAVGRYHDSSVVASKWANPIFEGTIL